MRPSLALLLVLAASPAGAQQLYLSFDDCNAAGSAKTRFLDCSSTSAVTTIVTSVDPGPQAIPDVIADLGIVDLMVGTQVAPTMPAFWQFQQGGCGSGNWLFGSDFNTAGPYTCHDTWQGLAPGGGQFGGIGGPSPDGNRARVKYTWAMDPPSTASLPANTESYLCMMTVRQTHWPACPEGCMTITCAFFVEEQLLQSGGEVRTINAWDMLAFKTTDTQSCLVPVQRTSWGRMKALYR